MSPNRVTHRIRGSSARSSSGNDSGHESESSDVNPDIARNCSNDLLPDKEQSHSSSSDDSPSESSRNSDSTSSSTSSDSASSDNRREKKHKRSSNKKKSSKRKYDRLPLRGNSNLEVPKLAGADDYELLRTMIELKLRCKSFGRPRLAGRYRILVNCNPVFPFQEIEKEYNAADPRGARVDTFIDAVMKLQEDIVTLSFPVEDAEFARLLLTNALEVFLDLSNELAAARLKRSMLEVGRVRGRLLAREQEENMRGSQGSHNPTTFHCSTTTSQLACKTLEAVSQQTGGSLLNKVTDGLCKAAWIDVRVVSAINWVTSIASAHAIMANLIAANATVIAAMMDVTADFVVEQDVKSKTRLGPLS
ncbi:hypothetical protein ON010_g11231 [Phytophthora cinnamomi]|nr:hypothetical protein ON010_g11231 [Phytophthora cinnamomi]